MLGDEVHASAYNPPTLLHTSGWYDRLQIGTRIISYGETTTPETIRGILLYIVYIS